MMSEQSYKRPRESDEINSASKAPRVIDCTKTEYRFKRAGLCWGPQGKYGDWKVNYAEGLRRSHRLAEGKELEKSLLEKPDGKRKLKRTIRENLIRGGRGLRNTGGKGIREGRGAKEITLDGIKQGILEEYMKKEKGETSEFSGGVFGFDKGNVENSEEIGVVVSGKSRENSNVQVNGNSERRWDQIGQGMQGNVNRGGRKEGLERKARRRREKKEV